MSNTPQLQTLGAEIASTSKCLAELLSQASMPQRSLSAGGPTMYPSSSHHPQIFQERSKLAEMAMQMFQLAMGPSDTLRWMVGPLRIQIGVLKVIDHFNIDSHVPSTGSIPISALATRIEVEQDHLERILHLAFSLNMFEEFPRGHIRHTALSQALPALKAWTTLNCRSDFQMPLMSWPDAIRSDSPNHSPWQLSNSNSNSQSKKKAISFFAKLAKEPPPNGMQLFGQAMRDHATVAGSNANLYLSAFDFASLGSGPLIDIGGGNGHVAVTIANAFPNLRIIVQDTSSNEQHAADTISEALRDRVTYQVHDFFQPQPEQMRPPKGYFLRVVLHDWPDRDAVRILKQLLPAVERDGARIFIVDRMLPDTGVKPTVHHSLVYFMDLLMFSLLDAKERSKEGVEILLKQVDLRLRILKFVQPVGSEWGFMEIGF